MDYNNKSEKISGNAIICNIILMLYIYFCPSPLETRFVETRLLNISALVCLNSSGYAILKAVSIAHGKKSISV